MIKICYVIGQLKRGGAEKQLYELIKGLSKEKFETHVISLTQGGYWSEEIRKLGVPVNEFQTSKGKRFSRLFGLVKLFKEIRPDIVHTYLFAANTYGRVAAIITGALVIIASERNEAAAGKDKKIAEIFIDKILSAFSDAIICNSSRAATILLERYSFSRKKVITIHNGIHTSKCLAGGSRKNSPYTVIGTIGRLYPQKNHRLFLEMAKIIIEKYPVRKVQFIIVGNGPLEDELIKYARSLGINGHVIFTGERTDIHELLHRMDIFVMTSDYEGLSNAIMEAMSAGIPVVATNVGGNGELVVHGKTGFLSPPKNALTLAEQIIDLMNDEEIIVKMGESGRERMLNEFPISKMVRDTESIYVKIVREKKSGKGEHGGSEPEFEAGDWRR